MFPVHAFLFGENDPDVSKRVRQRIGFELQRAVVSNFERVANDRPHLLTLSLTVALPVRGSLSPTRGKLEARAGIEPAHRAFAELGLTTWLPRLNLFHQSTYVP